MKMRQSGERTSPVDRLEFIVGRVAGHADGFGPSPRR
jgi:hypothetical protein